MLSRRRLSRLALTALAAFLALAALAPAKIDKQSGVTFSATAGQEFSGKVAEFHSDGKEPDPAQFTARIYWGDGTQKTDGTIEPVAGKPNDFEVHGKHTYANGGTCKASIEIKEPGTGQVVTVESTANVSGPQGPPCGSSGGGPPPDPPKPPPDPPQAAIADLYKNPRQASVTLFSSKSTPGSASITSYHWDFGDGASADEGPGTGITDHVYDEPGSYTVTLTVSDANGLKSTATKTVEVLGAPKAVIDFTPKKGKAETQFTLRGNKSSVPGGKIVRWQWRCIGKKITEQDSADKKVKSPKDQFRCTFNTLKNAWAELTVTSDQGETATATTTMPVKPTLPPTASFAFAPEDPIQDQVITFDASASASHPLGDGGGIKKYEWDWGDGTKTESSTPVAEHAYSETNNFKVRLTVTDDDGSAHVERSVGVSSKCHTDITVRGLQLRSGCLRQTWCQAGGGPDQGTYKPVCYDGEPQAPAQMNGVDIASLQGGSIRIDTTTGIVDSFPGFLRASYGPLKLGDGGFTIPEGGGPKVVRDSWRLYGTKIHGFEAKSDPVLFNPDGTSFLPINIKLPAPLSKVSGHVDVAASNDSPVYLGTIHIEAGDIPFPPFHLNHVSFDYSEADDSWYGSLSFDSPSGTFGGDVGFVGGSLNHLGLFGENLNYPLGEGVFLQRVAGSYTHNPRQISADVGLSAGPQLCIPGVGCGALFELGGSFNLTYDSEGGWTAALNGSASMIAVPLGLNVGASYQSIGRFDTDVHFSTTLYAVFEVTADFHLAFFEPSLWQVGAAVNICTKYIVDECAGGDLVVSNKGIAACIRLPAWLPDVGGYYIWGAGSVEFYFSGCSVGDVLVAKRSITAAQERAFTVRPGTTSEVLAFEGRDGPPKVILTGPKGERMETPDDGYDMTKPFFVSQEPEDKTTYVILGDNPSPGRWTVSVSEGSTPVVKMSRAQGIPDPKVKAKVSGSGLKRRLTWDATPIQGQRISFSEQGAKSGAVLGETTKAKGSLSFTPTDGPKGKRTIVAEVIQSGKPRAKLNVATYTAPRVGPGKPGKLKLRRRGTSLVATWSKAAGATGYEVNVTLSDGRLIPILTDKRTATIPGFGKTESATVTVSGYRVEGMNGPAAKASLKPPKPKKKRRG